MSDRSRVAVACIHCRLDQAADEALATGQPVPVEGTDVVAFPDTLVVEAVANGADLPATATARRSDGRTVYLFSRGAR